MQKKKNSKSTKEILIAILIILFCLGGAGASIYLFVNDFYKTLYKQNETPIAEITFKHKTAQRKFIDREIWDRLKQHSPLYNGDTIRTAPISEATVHFGENTIELMENTIVQLAVEGGEVVVDVSGGGVLARAGENSNGFKLKIGGISTTLERGSALSAFNDGKTLVTNIQIINGRAILENGEIIGEGNSAFFENGVRALDIPIITVLSPYANQKVLRLSEKPIPIEFKWKVENLADDDELLLEISDQKDFQFFATHELKGKNSITLDFDGESKYWRIYPKKFGKKFQAQSKISFIEGEKVNLVIPVENYSETYRTTLPSTKFMWEENEWASGYLLEISARSDFSDNAVEFSTTENFAIINSLGEGEWFWRVTPEFANTLKNEKLSSETRSFEIRKTDDIDKPRLIAPQKESVINSNEKPEVAFSWKRNPEAAAYNIKVATDENFLDCIVDEDTTDNHISSDILEEGTYFWKVTLKDKDGIEAPSETRSFAVENDSFNQKLIFPPENYAVESDRLPSVSFLWKTSEKDKTKTEFELSDTPDFSNTLLLENNETSETSLKELPVGQYYWRIKTATDDGDMISPARSFTVKEKFKAPETLFPQGKIKIGVDKDKPVHFEWEKIDDADSYKFRLYSAENSKRPVFENNSAKENAIDVDMSKMKSGEYIWTVQANSSEKEDATRFSGNVGTHEFSMRLITRLELLRPYEGTSIDGMKNNTNGVSFRWKSEEKARDAVFRLYKNERLVREIKNPREDFTIRQLESGNYAWTVNAVSAEDGLDISPLENRTFSIGKIASLSKPILTSPKNRTDFSAKDLKKMTSITFKWNEVKGANAYIATIKDSNGKTIFRQNLGKATKLKFSNLTSLSRGTFVWNIEARMVGANNTVLTKSVSENCEFTINLPELGDIKLNDAGELYGL